LTDNEYKNLTEENVCQACLRSGLIWLRAEDTKSYRDYFANGSSRNPVTCRICDVAGKLRVFKSINNLHPLGKPIEFMNKMRDEERTVEVECEVCAGTGTACYCPSIDGNKKHILHV
jgi:hypothetical protein